MLASHLVHEGSAALVLAGSGWVPGCGGGCLLASESTASGADAQLSNPCVEQVATVERLCRMYVNGFFVADLANLCRLLDILAGPHTGLQRHVVNSPLANNPQDPAEGNS